MPVAYTNLNSRTRYKFVDHSIHICIGRFMIEAPTRYEALVMCRDRAGSDSQMARDLETTQPKVWRWINQSKQLPPEYVLVAERIYGVSRHHLRPDIYPVDLPPASSRWSGVDRYAAARANGVDRRGSRVSLNNAPKSKGVGL
jgi:DNA-binding transcriptional regulator YdaS (Cro superfamily)